MFVDSQQFACMEVESDDASGEQDTPNIGFDVYPLDPGTLRPPGSVQDVEAQPEIFLNENLDTPTSRQSPEVAEATTFTFESAGFLFGTSSAEARFIQRMYTLFLIS